MKKQFTQKFLRGQSFFNWILLLYVGAANITCCGQQPYFAEPQVNIDGSFTAKLVSVPGQSYTIEVTTNLLTWQPKYSYTNAANELIFIDPPGFQNGGQRYYRAKLGTSVVSRLTFDFSAYGGAWSQGWIPVLVKVLGYNPRFVVENDSSYPPADQVFFTGPGGSGFTNTAATVLNGWEYDAQPVLPDSLAVGGLWMVTYSGRDLLFDVPNPAPDSRLVIPFPAVTESGGNVRVSWTYKDATNGLPLGLAPWFITELEVSLAQRSSGSLPPQTTEYTFTALVLPREANVTVRYSDTFGNSYSVLFSQLTP